MHIVYLDKGKPAERRGRKSTGLRGYPRTAGLPKWAGTASW